MDEPGNPGQVYPISRSRLPVSASATLLPGLLDKRLAMFIKRKKKDRGSTSLYIDLYFRDRGNPYFEIGSPLLFRAFLDYDRRMKNARRKREERAERLSRIPSSSGSTVALDEPNEDATPSGEPASVDQEAAATQRITMPVGSDGRIDAARLREKTRAALRHALSDPALPAALGMSEPATANATDPLINTIAGAVYDGASALLIWLAHTRFKISAQHAVLLGFTPEDKTLLQAPTAAVIAKYLPDLGGKYQEELILALALTNVIAGKVVAMRTAIAQERAAAA